MEGRLRGKPPYVLLYPDVKMMAGNTVSGIVLTETDFLFHVMALALI